LLGLGALLAPTHAQASDCVTPGPILFSYPSAGATGVPSNAIPFAIPDGFTQVQRFLLDQRGSFSIDAGTRTQLARFQPGALFTPGPHEIRVEVDVNLEARAPSGWEEEVIPFEVDAEQALPPNETSAAKIVRIVQLLPNGAEGTLAHQGYAQEKRRLEQRMTDCSAFLGEQTLDFCSFGGRPEAPRNFNIELEAQGDPLGYVVNGLFLPGHCRSAFFPEPEAPWSIQTVTATGLGPPEDFAGAVERLVPAPLERPPVPPGHGRESWWDSACGLPPAAPTRSQRGTVLCLLATCTALALRARRST
jgi:hypothetical protein